MNFKAMHVRVSKVNDVEVRSLMSVLSVHADTMSDAVKQIEDQLTRNPSRQAYHDKWVADGRFVIASRD